MPGPAWSAVGTNREPRMLAIVGRFGYVTVEDDRLGWYVGEISKPTARIKIVRGAGGIVTQLGDREAVGHAPLAAIEKLLSAIGAYRVTSDESNAMNALRASERFNRLGPLQVPAGTGTAG